MAYALWNGHVTDDVTWPWKVKIVTPIRLERNISITTWATDFKFGVQLCIGNAERAPNNFPESERGLGHVTPTIFGIRSNVSPKLLELLTSNLVCSFVWAMPSRRTNNFPRKWASPRSRDPYNFWQYDRLSKRQLGFLYIILHYITWESKIEKVTQCVKSSVRWPSVRPNQSHNNVGSMMRCISPAAAARR